MSDLFTGLANFTKTVSNTLNSYEMRKIGDKVQGYVMNFTEAEAKVREATNEDPWGPTGPQMQEIAGMTFQYDVYPEVMGMLWKRMFHENKVAWRRVYKSLVLLNYLLKNGSERVISTARDHLFEMRALEHYKCLDERGKDEGINVRHRVKLVMDLLQDEEQLRVERRKAKTESREKYQGFSKEEMLYKGGGKVSSFESWNAKSDSTNKNSNNYSDDFISSNHEDTNRADALRTGRTTTTGREITAFDFADGRDHSPELGIPDRTHEAFENNEDDDEFGKFSEARSAPNSAANSATAASGSALNASPIPTIAPPTATARFYQHSTTATTAIKALASPKPANDDPFGIFNSDLSSNSTANTFDIFGESSSTPVPAIISTPNATTLPAANMDAFAAIGDFSNGSIQNSTTCITGMNNSISLLDGFDFGTPIDAVSAPTLTPTRESSLHKQAAVPSKANTPSTPAIVNETPSKLPKTWEDFKGKVNIDFENLSLRPMPAKPTPTLNELQSQQTSTSNNTLW